MHKQFTEYTVTTRDYFTDMSYTEAAIRQQLSGELINLFLAFHKEQVIGFFLTQKPTGGVSMAIWLAVHEDFQKHGAATELLGLWEEIALVEGAHALQIWTRDHNIPFYKHRGFRLVGEFPQAWYRVDVSLLYKTIAEPQEIKYLRR